MKATLIESRKIWDAAPHNAFTDLVRWKDRFWCDFREGRGHVSTDGRIRVLTSDDGDKWASAAVIELAGHDLRDAHLSVTPAGKLMLVGGAAGRKKDGEPAPTNSFVSLSADGKEFTAAKLITEGGWWLWQVSWQGKTAYGVAYTEADKKYRGRLMTSDDGLTWTTLVDDWLKEHEPTEVTLRFDGDLCHALVRREGAQALLATAKPPYKEWTARQLGSGTNGFGGPNLLKTPAGWVAAGRMHDGVLWMSYYSSHEGKTSIYLAKVKLE